MTSIVGYLCWERKHKPEKSRRRTQHIRQSLALPRLLRGRTNQAFSPDSDQEIYNSIRNSAIMSTIDTNTVPTLPARPPGLEAIAAGNPGVYDYADPLRLRLHGRTPKGAKKLLANGTDQREEFKYGSSSDLNNDIQKEVELYMKGVSDGKVTAPTDLVRYSAANNCKQGNTLDEDEDTELLENMAYHSVDKVECQQFSDRAPGNAPPLQSCAKRNSYVPSPTEHKRIVNDQSHAKNIESGLNTDETDMYCLAHSLVGHLACPSGTTERASSPGDVSRQPGPPLNDSRGSMVGDGHVSSGEVPPSETEKSNVCSGANQRNSSSDDDHEMEIVDNEAYMKGVTSGKVTAPTDIPVAQSAVNNGKQGSMFGEDEDTELLDNMAYHSVVKVECQPTSDRAPVNVPALQSGAKRNSYVPSPTEHKRTANDQSHAKNIASGLNTDETDIYCLAQSLVGHPAGPSGKTGPVSSPGDVSRQPGPPLNDSRGSMVGDGHVSDCEVPPSETEQSHVCIGTNQRVSSSDDDHEMEIVDNEAYMVKC